MSCGQVPFGGKAEVEYIRNVRFISGFFVIYHGNTTILRLGDISLYDFSSHQIVAVGEMKAKRKKGEDTAQIAVLFSGPKFDELMRSKYPEGKKGAKPLDLDLNPKMKDRFGRQLKNLDQALNNISLPNKAVTKMFATSYVSELEALGKKLRVNQAVTQKLGDGLLLIGIEQRKKRASSRMLPKVEKGWQNELARVPEAIQVIRDPESQDNYLLLSVFHYSVDQGPLLVPGTLPLFFWDLDIDLIRKIIFGDVLFVVVYNPVHFIKKLRESGFTVKIDKNDSRKIEVSRHEKDMIFQLKGFEHYLGLIQLCLYPEEEVVKLIKTYLEVIKANDVPSNSIVELEFIQMT